MEKDPPAVLAAGLFAAVGLCEGTGLGRLPTGRAVVLGSSFLEATTGFAFGLTGFLLGRGFGWGLWLLGLTAVGFRAVGLARRADGLPGLWMGFATGCLLRCLRLLLLPLRTGFLCASTRRLCAPSAASGGADCGQSKPWLSRSGAC